MRSKGEPCGFFWCSGSVTRPELWEYHAIILNPHPGRGKSRTIEFRGEDPDDLRGKILEGGYEVVGDVKHLCESAPLSPHIKRAAARAPGREPT